MNAREQLDKIKLQLNLKTDEELAKNLGTFKSNIDSWIKRDKIPDKWKLILGQNVPMQQNNYTNDLITVNVYKNVYASAGYGTFNDNTLPTKMQFDKNFLRTFLNITRFDNLDIIRVTGDSMLPAIKDGEYIIIERCSDAKNGDTVIANIYGELYVKRFYRTPFEKWIKLESENKDYPSIELNTLEKLEALNIIGVVKSKIKLY